MPLVEDDHVVETLTSNGADHPFDKWILPRGARCGKDLLDPETVDASIEVRSVGLVSIPYQVPRRRVPWKSIDHLLRRPLGRRMFGDIEMNDTATLVAKDDEDEQNSEGCGRQSEKVERHQVLYMIIEKAPPSMGRWHAMANLYLETAAWEMEMPSFASSPCTRGAPQSGLALLMFRISSRIRERRLVVRAYAVGSSKSNIV